MIANRRVFSYSEIMDKRLTALNESVLRQKIGSRLSMLREANGSPMRDWVRRYPSFLSTPSKLFNWEVGKNLPPLSFLVQVAKDHHVTLDWLITGQESPDLQSRMAKLRARQASGDTLIQALSGTVDKAASVSASED